MFNSILWNHVEVSWVIGVHPVIILILDWDFAFQKSSILGYPHLWKPPREETEKINNMSKNEDLTQEDPGFLVDKALVLANKSWNWSRIPPVNKQVDIEPASYAGRSPRRSQWFNQPGGFSIFWDNTFVSASCLCL